MRKAISFAACGIGFRILIAIVIFTSIYNAPVFSGDKDIEIRVPDRWQSFKPILQARHGQSENKMKLDRLELISFMIFLEDLDSAVPELEKLQYLMPRTALELLRAVSSREVDLSEAEAIASFMKAVPNTYGITNIAYFDENTSHIIGRDWSEIDYGGEGMTWQEQQLKYEPYGITSFKTLENIARFLSVESKLPYFYGAYK